MCSVVCQREGVFLQLSYFSPTFTPSLSLLLADAELLAVCDTCTHQAGWTGQEAELHLELFKMKFS